MNFTFIEKQGWGGNHSQNAVESIVCSDLANTLERLFSHESSVCLGCQLSKLYVSKMYLSVHPTEIGIICIPLDALRKLKPPLG